MQKFFIGFLLGAVVFGSVWFFTGRPDIKRVRIDFNRVNGNFEDLQRISDQVSVDASGLTGDITGINTESREANERLDNIIGNNQINTDQIRLVSGKVDELEQINIKLIRLGRPLGDVAFDAREIYRNYGESE